MTDLQLQKVLAKMLPEKIRMSKRHGPVWIEENAVVEHTEWLHICWLIEQGLIGNERLMYFCNVLPKVAEFGGATPFSNEKLAHISWQKRAAALVTVKEEK